MTIILHRIFGDTVVFTTLVDFAYVKKNVDILRFFFYLILLGLVLQCT